MRVKSIFLRLVLVILTSDLCDGADQIVESFRVRSDIWYRFATTRISSVIRNVDSSAQKIRFAVTLPKKAFIVAFHMDIDGTRYDGHVEERLLVPEVDQATLIGYGGADFPRLAPRQASIFEVLVNASAGSAANFTLTYQELLHRRKGRYDYGLYISPGQPVEDFLIQVEARENRPLTFVRTPALKSDSLYTDLLSDFDSVNLNELTTISRPSPESATVMYQPSIDQQGGGGGNGLSAMFSVQYDLEHGGPEGDIIVSDGYFVHFLAPPKLERVLPKDIVFVLDKSGSMWGTKMQQLQEAMATILSQLMPQDRFNIITFSYSPSAWRERLANVKNSTIKYADSYIQSISPFGGTNINSALLTALSQFKIKRSRERVEIVFLLTDGEASVGEVDMMKITENVAKENKRRVGIFSLAFGEDADYSSLRVLSAQNFGYAKKIYEGSDAAQQVYSLYEEISSISIKALNVDYQKGTLEEFSLTQSNFPIVFNGTEVVIAGQLGVHVEALKYDVTGIVPGGDLGISAEVSIGDTISVGSQGGNGQISVSSQGENGQISLSSQGENGQISVVPGDGVSLVERMWAYEMIQQLLILQETHVNDTDKREELNERISALSLKYQYVTPPTHMVVPQPEQEVAEVKKLDLENVDAVTALREPAAAMHLSLVTLTLKQDAATSKSICMVPRRWTYGNIVLLSEANNTKVVLKQCRRKLCPGKPTLEGLKLESGSKWTEVLFQDTGKWFYHSSPPRDSPAFTVTAVSHTVLRVSGSGLTAVIEWTLQNQTASYKIRLTVDGSLSRGGLLGDLDARPGSRLQELTRMATKKAKRLCRGENTDFIAMMFDRRARRYSVYRLSRSQNGVAP